MCFNRLYCCYGDLLHRSNDRNFFTSDLAFVWNRYCSISCNCLTVVVLIFQSKAVGKVLETVGLINFTINSLRGCWCSAECIIKFISFIIYTKEYWPASRLFARKSFLLPTRGSVLGIFLDFCGTLEISLVVSLRLYGRNISTS